MAERAHPAAATEAADNPFDAAYLGLVRRILDDGHDRAERTGVGARSVFGHQMRFDLSRGFPLLTTKRVHVKSIVHELLWFLAGDTNIAYLKANGVSIWDEWADADGNLGPVYGRQWRSWPSRDGAAIDQMSDVLARLKSDPYSRRHVVSAWNPSDIPSMALPPCHCLFQFFVHEVAGATVLSCQLYQRSADVFLGVPFNIASYALLTAMVAQVIGARAGDFVHTLGDVHLYHNHFDQAKEQLSRSAVAAPRLVLNPEVTDLFAFRYEDVRITDYHPAPAIKAPIAV